MNRSVSLPLFRRTVGLAALFAAFASMTVATGALAMRHLRLMRSFPAASEVLTTSPDAVRLWLSEAPELKLTKIALADGSGKAVKLGPVTRDSVKGKGVAAAITTPLPNGAYTVTWRTMSKDGHVVKGDFAFRVGAAVPAK